MTWLEQVTQTIVAFVGNSGYLGIFVMTFFEANFLPLLSELALIPAGYLVYKGEMAALPVLLASIGGVVSGALFNYWIAYRFGRRLWVRYSRYLLMSEEKLRWIEHYFAVHGPISIFSGRLIPGLRHFISFPAGLSQMNLKRFTFYTLLGGAIWMGILTALGYFIGRNEDLLHRYLTHVTYAILAFLAVLAAVYVWRHRRKPKI